MATLNYTYYFIKHPSFFVSNIYMYKPIKKGLFNDFYFPTKLNLKFLEQWDLTSYLGVGLSTFPLLIGVAVFYKNLRKISFWIVLLIFSNLLRSKTCVGLIVSRIGSLLPLFLIVIFSYFLMIAFKKRDFSFVFIVFAILVNISPTLQTSINSIKDLYEYNPLLISKIKKMKNTPILFEERGIIVKEGIFSEFSPHLSGFISQTLNVSLLSNTRDGYHPSIFRKNTLQSGVFRGVRLNKIPVDQFNKFLNKWGVEYLVVWSFVAKDYFRRHPQFYSKEYQDKEWMIFKYKYATRNNIEFLNSDGEGNFYNLDYFLKILKLKDVKKGNIVVLKTNYFPEWRAFYKGKRIPVFNYDGQLAVRIPFDGEGQIIFKYPKHYFLSFLIIISFIMAFLIDKRLDSLFYSAQQECLVNKKDKER